GNAQRLPDLMTVHARSCERAVGPGVVREDVALVFWLVGVAPPDELRREDANAHFLLLGLLAEDASLIDVLQGAGLEKLVEARIDIAVDLANPAVRRGHAQASAPHATFVLGTDVHEGWEAADGAARAALPLGNPLSNERYFVTAHSGEVGPRLVAIIDERPGDGQASGRQFRGAASLAVDRGAALFPCEPCDGQGAHSWGGLGPHFNGTVSTVSGGSGG
ncbi:MAG: hypothetical protein ACT4PT_00660, partial [Methanobacteriota archaeon]